MKNLQFFIHNNIIMNWSNLRKCTLILFLGCGAHLQWVAWKVYILNTPALLPWVNLATLKTQIVLNSIAIVFFILLMALCYFSEGKKWPERILPHVVINVFTLAILHDGYTIGVFSPATITGYICISGLGLLLFKRSIVYPPLMFSSLSILILGLMTVQGSITYAPLFSFDLISHSPPHNLFWVQSMALFIIPILILSLILCEVLLMQWRYRESIIQKLSQMDPLTNLNNRRSFNDQLRTLHCSNKSYSIIILDLDYFKNINDQYGHAVGDDVLEQVALTLSQNVRETDLLARYGGEEFIILVHDANMQTCRDIAERCRRAIKHLKIYSSSQALQITASFGIASSISECDSEQIVSYADQALYSAKQLGRDQVYCYDHAAKFYGADSGAVR